MVNDKAEATYGPDEALPPLETVGDMLKDVVDLLDGVDELVIAHRRAAGDDHHQLEKLQTVSSRIGQAWTAVVSARKALRS